MAGRPRRRRASSASTVATPEPSQTRWAKELSVLKPAPSGVQSNDWPCYVLTDATIYRADGKTLANPLLDYIHGHMIVRGRLEDPEDFTDNLIRPNAKPGRIEIARSTLYSIGDRPLALWVSGAAGWYEIKPSTKYQRMYNQVMEAMTLYYSAFEVHDELRKSKKKGRKQALSVLDKVFLQYAVRAGDGILRHEVEALCHRWAEFLIAHFEKDDELDWSESPFANWLRELYPDVHKRAIKMAQEGTAPVPPPEPEVSDEVEAAQKGRRSRSARASSRNSDIESEPRVPPSKRSRSPQSEPLSKSKAKISETPVPVPEKYKVATRPTSSKPSPVPVQAPEATPRDAPAPEDTPEDAPMPEAEPDNPVDRLLLVLQEIATEVDVSKAGASSIQSKAYFKCKMRKYIGAKDILAYYAKDLLRGLPAGWKGGPFYRWLEGVARKPWVPAEPMDPSTFPSQTLRRTKAAKPAVSTNSATQLPPSINLKARAKQVVQSDESEDDIAELPTAPQRSRRSGKGATLRLAAGSKKRPRSEVDDGASGSRRGRKAAKTSHQFSDQDELADDFNDTSEDDLAAQEVIGDEESAVGSRLPLPEGAVRVVVHAEPIPTTSPSGPDGTWTCDQEGCTYVVRSADEEDAQRQIKEHFKVHEAQAEKINLAVKESRGHMPIHYLLDKIQALGRAAFHKDPETVNGQPVPRPVKRRLLV